VAERGGLVLGSDRPAERGAGLVEAGGRGQRILLRGVRCPLLGCDLAGRLVEPLAQHLVLLGELVELGGHLSDRRGGRIGTRDVRKDDERTRPDQDCTG
jgi:hypothetical protein